MLIEYYINILNKNRFWCLIFYFLGVDSIKFEYCRELLCVEKFVILLIYVRLFKDINLLIKFL